VEQQKQWRWVENGVEFLGEMRAFTKLDPENLGAFIEELSRTSDLQHVLNEARQSFAEGRADYANCADRLSELLVGRRTAILAWYDLMRRLGAYFQPKLDVMKLPPDDVEAFAYEGTLKLSEHLDRQLAPKTEQPAAGK